ncbi:MAG: quinoprotein dehydrogenase-associated SoxYZ-like carrier [Alphaproteobacteria bacterium]|nr:quinoprotein dehydrogenase-associated SoxYZ-like carrier [Alphaproteobacteria bacterium]
MSGVLLRLAAFLALLAVLTPPCAQADEADELWHSLVQDIFNNRTINDGSNVIAIEMPARAEDAGIVPFTLRSKIPGTGPLRIRSVSLVIDHNPAPLAAKFEFGPRALISEISGRVRVNSYTDVHAVAELSDGQLYMSKIFVKASGGCSAPAQKNLEQARNQLGEMRYRQFGAPAAPSPGQSREAQIMIRHPNNSGLQMDQLTQLYIPPFFINELRLWQDDDLLFTMEGGISISEDPNFRFTYVWNGARHFRAEAKDTEHHVFHNEWPITDNPQ